MRVLLTGGTGLVGGHIARALLAAGHEVRALTRASSDLQNLAGLDLEHAAGDVTQPGTLGAACAGCEAVVHTAGLNSWSPLHTRRIHEVNVDGTRNVAEAAASSGVRRLVVTSSVAAVGGSRIPRELDEHSPWELGPLGVPYLTAKRAGEEVAFATGAARGLEVISVNPGFVTGPGDIYGSSSAIVLAVVKGGMPAYVEGGASIVDVRDVAAGHVAALERGRAGERYILGGENLTMTAFMTLIGRVAGVKTPRRVPRFVAWFPAALSDIQARLTGRPRPLSRNLLKASALYTFASSAKAAGELGYTFRPVEGSLADTLRYFLGAGRLPPRTPELERLALTPPQPAQPPA